MKAAVIYVSNSGNTEIMAQTVAHGVQSAGCDVFCVEAGKITPSKTLEYDRIAFGCPACGAEELDEQMESLFSAVENKLGSKTIGLFGSYDWGSGDWMKQWCERVLQSGAKLATGVGIIANLEPDDNALEQCKRLGQALCE